MLSHTHIVVHLRKSALPALTSHGLYLFFLKRGDPMKKCPFETMEMPLMFCWVVNGYRYTHIE